ncbi:ABC transporter ATP-binding protein [Nocardioides zeae]|uniref:ABC transporter ATP-binding protein n=1 Tax=Nocardioides imazamoxiresistens TaxID=3231893 RepID=A0ABU3PTT8_9ACTN|nr:ABC transporter ATP-binding protein [Nocardioides zeae]MDT9592311.1 ABC transporter ATP-binding protein [Nocardioides zeae]
MSAPATPETGRTPLLSVRDLRVRFTRDGRTTTAVDEVAFDVAPGQNVALVGESGSGKSVTSLAVMGLLPARGVEVSGSVTYDGRDLLGMRPRELERLRGPEIAMVFQDPMTSLNPVVTVGTQLDEVLKRHFDLSRRERRERCADLLARVGIPDPVRRLKEYPHQLSGGMRQRVLIAIALACEPRLLIADEPTTALDVTIQAQVLDVLAELVAGSSTALLLITHDLGVVAGVCDEVNVMYAGRIVEQAPRRPLFAAPAHPYTDGLLGSIPRLDTPRGAPLVPIPGSPTQTLPWADACAFAPRCPRVEDDCRAGAPRLEARGEGRDVRCFHPLVPTATRKDLR